MRVRVPLTGPGGPTSAAAAVRLLAVVRLLLGAQLALDRSLRHGGDRLDPVGAPFRRRSPRRPGGPADPGHRSPWSAVLSPDLMASTLGHESVSLEASPKHQRHPAPRHAQVRRRSTLTVVAWVTAPRVAMAFVLSAVTERTAAVGTAGPAVHGVASGLLNWDGAHYLSIAEHGYVTVFDTIFFPLQPLLARPSRSCSGFPTPSSRCRGSRSGSQSGASSTSPPV